MDHIGIDIIEIKRISGAISRWNVRFLRRVFTEPEIEQYHNHLESLAARFAAKEAVMKALDAADSGIRFRDIEVLATTTGKPVVRLYGVARQLAEARGIAEFAVSLSHSREYAIAVAIGQKF